MNKLNVSEAQNTNISTYVQNGQLPCFGSMPPRQSTDEKMADDDYACAQAVASFLLTYEIRTNTRRRKHFALVVLILVLCVPLLPCADIVEET